MKTYTEVMTPAGVAIPAHLEAQAEIPVLSGLQAQGDVAVVPAAYDRIRTVEPVTVPAEGIAVVRGEAGGNTHLLMASGPAQWLPTPRIGPDLLLGLLLVPAGSTAWLLHPEHGCTGIAPGSYELRRQREMADQVRIVAD